MDKVQIDNLEFETLIEHKQIEERIGFIAKEINELKLGNPVFIIILKGAFWFGSEIIKKYEKDCEVQFLQTSSYSGLTSGKSFRMGNLHAETIKDRDIIIIEDILDTGKTLTKITNYLGQSSPKSVRIAVLLKKNNAAKHAVKVDFCGFEIPDQFVIGFGLDYDEKGRNLKNIYVKTN